MDLFERESPQEKASHVPLAERVRPKNLEDFVGQDHLTGEGKLLRAAIEEDKIPSLVLWGPPGTGKTTLAQVIAHHTGATFRSLSAVLSGVKDIREEVSQAEERWRLNRKRTVLFIDEIHRFNKAQQDALLPHVERGTLTLIGATTENPSFEVNAALLSRTRVVTLRALGEEELIQVMRRALALPEGLAGKVQIDDDALTFIAQAAGGDARRALTALEVAGQLGHGQVNRACAEEAVQQKVLLYDRAGEEHYNVVSAFIKSMRGSDPDAAVYWMVRMLEAGEEPRFVLRRMVIFASEDIGNADPRALSVATDALRAFELMGMPEGSLPMTQAVLYLSLAPKSNAVLTSYANARKAVVDKGALPVPLKLRNAPTPLMGKLGYGGGYKYPHDFSGHYVVEAYLPEQLEGVRFFNPGPHGPEREMAERLEKLRADPRAVQVGEGEDDDDEGS